MERAHVQVNGDPWCRFNPVGDGMEGKYLAMITAAKSHRTLMCCGHPTKESALAFVDLLMEYGYEGVEVVNGPCTAVDDPF